MPMDENAEPPAARAALDRLKRREYRSGVGLLLYEPEEKPNWNAVALVHSIGLRDYVRLLLEELNPATRYVNLDADTERDRLIRLSEIPDPLRCVLVTEFDIALARMKFEERTRLWNNLLHHFPHRQTTLLLAIPANASYLLPDADALTLWTEAGKTISLNDL